MAIYDINTANSRQDAERRLKSYKQHMDRTARLVKGRHDNRRTNMQLASGSIAVLQIVGPSSLAAAHFDQLTVRPFRLILGFHASDA